MAWHWTSPPGVPNGRMNLPRRIAIPGFGVRRGRFRGATAAGWSGSVQDCDPREDTHNPVPGTTGVSPEMSLGVAEKALPNRSMTQTYDVSSVDSCGPFDPISWGI